jgi:GntR family transcriptional regulator
VRIPLLKRNSVSPLYTQIYEQLYEQINSGDLKPGDQIPPELNLVEDFGVARVTVRRAIADLVEEGVLVRHAGKGTFVAKPKIERKLVNVTSFSSRMAAVGMHARSHVVSRAVIPATRLLASELDLELDAPVVSILRVRFSDEEPVSLERVYMSLQRFPKLDTISLENISLYDLLEKEYNITPIRSKKLLELAIARPEEAELLHLDRAGAPLFLMRTTVYGQEFPIEYAKILMRGDRFRFQV